MKPEYGKSVGCCEASKHLIIEMANDQDGDPGYRHIRMSITSTDDSFLTSSRIRFCPFCGTEFKGPGLDADLNPRVLSVNDHYRIDLKRQ